MAGLRTRAEQVPGTWRRMANLRALVDLPTRLARLQGSGAPAVRLDAGPYPIAYLTTPETVTAVLDGRVEGVAERGRFFEEIARVIGASSLVTCEGAQHRRLRRLLATAFRPDQVAAYGEAMLAASAARTADWRAGETIRLEEAMAQLTLDVAARALFGLEGADSLDEVAAVLAAGTRLFYRLLLPRRVAETLWRSRWSPVNRRLATAQARLDRFVDDLLAERRSIRLGRPSTADGRPANLLDVLLAGEEADAALTAAEVRDQIVTFLFAGHETTAQALTWTFVLLDRHPGVRARLEAELDGVLGGRRPTVSDLPALRYTRATVRESLRLCPPVWFLSREASRQTVIGDCSVPPGALLLASPLALHRDGRLFPDPLVFDPLRFLASEAESVAPEGYLPFGHGRRNCIGSSFALTELVLVVAAIAGSWRLRLAAPGRVREHPTVTLRPRKSVEVILEKR